jgi:hypothetical protein
MCGNSCHFGEADSIVKDACVETVGILASFWHSLIHVVLGQDS